MTLIIYIAILQDNIQLFIKKKKKKLNNHNKLKHQIEFYSTNIVIMLEKNLKRSTMLIAIFFSKIYVNVFQV